MEVKREALKRHEVLKRLVTGMTTAEIAEDMGTNERCVTSHITSLFKEYKVNKRCKLVANYWKHKVYSSWL